MNDQQMRADFEAWIGSPPFEHMCDRFPTDTGASAWPGRYKRYETELAWEAWQAALRASGERTGKESSQVAGERVAAAWTRDDVAQLLGPLVVHVGSDRYEVGIHQGYSVTQDIDEIAAELNALSLPSSISEAALREALMLAEKEMPLESNLRCVVAALRKLGIHVQK